MAGTFHSKPVVVSLASDQGFISMDGLGTLEALSFNQPENPSCMF
jgi:hypothetical protein